MSPEFLGPYKIERLIGQGGMGAVYKASHAKTGQIVAVKIISHSVGDQSRFRRRFQAEIDTLKRLKHPNIAQLIGYGEEQGQLFYSMEYVEGQTLHDCLKTNGPMPWDSVLQIGIEICSALKHAHDFGIIHRDLKPANILINEAGGSKLVDFGIAKLFGAAEMTVAGSIVGTADYMSPEQAEGKTATLRSDLYSLGSILYAALSGKAPFAGKSVPETLYALKFTDPIPIRRLAKDTPIELAELVEQLLAKDPGHRPPTALVVGNRMKAMKQGLKKKSETQAGNEVTNHETHTSLDLNDFHERLIDLPTGTSDRLTLNAANLPPSQPTDPTLLARPQTNPILAMEGSAHLSDFQSLSAEVDSSNTMGGTHFTVVEHEKVGKATPSETTFLETDPKSNLISITLIAGALAACMLGVIYAFLPPTADGVYQEISPAIESRDSNTLSQSYDKLVYFLERFPSDERAEIVKAAKSEVEAFRLLKKLDNTNRLNNLSSNTVLDFTVANVIKMSESDPESAFNKLKLILKIYEASADLSAAKEQQLEALRLLSSKLEKQIADREGVFQKELLELVLAQEQKLKGENKMRFMRGIVELYQGDEWAAPAVEYAQKVISAESR